MLEVVRYTFEISESPRILTTWWNMQGTFWWRSRVVSSMWNRWAMEENWKIHHLSDPRHRNKKRLFRSSGNIILVATSQTTCRSKSDSNLFKSRGERSRFQNSFWSCLATNTVSNSIGVACASHRTTTSCLMWRWWTSEWRTTKTCCNTSAPSIHLNNIRSCWYKSKSQSHPVTRATIRNTCDFEIESAYLLGRREVCDSFQTVWNSFEPMQIFTATLLALARAWLTRGYTYFYRNSRPFNSCW